MWIPRSSRIHIMAASLYFFHISLLLLMHEDTIFGLCNRVPKIVCPHKHVEEVSSQINIQYRSLRHMSSSTHKRRAQKDWML